VATLSELNGANSQAYCILADLSCLCDPTFLATELRKVAGAAKWTLNNRLATVNGHVRCGANVERIILVVLELVGVCGCPFTGGQNFACLLDYKKNLVLIHEVVFEV
jgi:hypothetical protein